MAQGAWQVSPLWALRAVFVCLVRLCCRCDLVAWYEKEGGLLLAAEFGSRECSGPCLALNLFTGYCTQTFKLDLRSRRAALHSSAPASFSIARSLHLTGSAANDRPKPKREETPHLRGREPRREDALLAHGVLCHLPGSLAVHAVARCPKCFRAWYLWRPAGAN